MSTLFASFLGYNPVQNLLAPSDVLAHLPPHNVAVLTGKQFFPHLISAPFHHGLVIVFTAAAIMSVTGALVSLLRGKQFYYDDKVPSAGRFGRHGPERAGSFLPRAGNEQRHANRPGQEGYRDRARRVKWNVCPAMSTAAAPAVTRSS